MSETQKDVVEYTICAILVGLYLLIQRNMILGLI